MSLSPSLVERNAIFLPSGERRRLTVRRCVAGQPGLPRAVGVHRVDLEVPVARRLEDDSRTSSGRASRERVVPAAVLPLGVLWADAVVIGRVGDQPADRLADVQNGLAEVDGADGGAAPIRARRAVVEMVGAGLRQAPGHLRLEVHAAVGEVAEPVRQAHRATREQGRACTNHRDQTCEPAHWTPSVPHGRVMNNLGDRNCPQSASNGSGGQAPDQVPPILGASRGCSSVG